MRAGRREGAGSVVTHHGPSVWGTTEQIGLREGEGGREGGSEEGRGEGGREGGGEGGREGGRGRGREGEGGRE